MIEDRRRGLAAADELLQAAIAVVEELDSCIVLDELDNEWDLKVKRLREAIARAREKAELASQLDEVYTVDAI